MRKCTDPLCTICYPEQWEWPKEMGWTWPWLTIGLIVLALFVFFVVLFMAQGGAFRPALGG
jgi:hypothetical protein